MKKNKSIMKYQNSFYNKNPIGTLSEYQKIINKLVKEWDPYNIWFRGLTKKKYKLIPSIYRKGGPLYNSILENDIVYGFIRKAKALNKLENYSYSRWEWFHILQHYGVPTRMLDWTESSLIALYFAVREPTLATSPCVWILDPFWLNITSTGKNVIYFTDPSGQTEEDELANHYHIASEKLPKYPIAISPPYIDGRLRAQQSCFTIYGSFKNGLHLLSKQEKKSRLVQISINRNKVEDIKNELFVAGIRESTIMPDYEGLAREIKYEYGYE